MIIQKELKNENRKGEVLGFLKDNLSVSFTEVSGQFGLSICIEGEFTLLDKWLINSVVQVVNDEKITSYKTDMYIYLQLFVSIEGNENQKRRFEEGLSKKIFFQLFLRDYSYTAAKVKIEEAKSDNDITDDDRLLILSLIPDEVSDESQAQTIYAHSLANRLKDVLKSHGLCVVPSGEGLGRKYHVLADIAHFPINTNYSYNLTTLIALTSSLMLAYNQHLTDAVSQLPSYHLATGTNYSLAYLTSPTNLVECTQRLDDLKLKYNQHDNDALAHGLHGLWQV